MRKIHITLVGGQPMPVYLGISYCKPDAVLFIYSKETEKQKQAIKKEVIENKLISEDSALKSEALDPVNMEEIEAAAIQYKEKFANDEVSINISGGTKAWSYFFAKVFENSPNAKILYIDQNNCVHDLKSKTTEYVQNDILVQFKLNKNPLKVYTPFNVYTERDFEMIGEIEKIRRTTDIGIFTKLTNVDLDKKGTSPNNQVGDSKIKCENESCEIAIAKSGNIKKFALSSPHICDIIFNAAWFELKVAKILSEWSKAKNIYMNCKFVVNNGQSIEMAAKNPKNEVDIIVDTGDKALFVECKTNIARSTDIDKFNNVVKNVGGSGSKALFVCLNSFGEKEREKFRDCNMLTYSFKESNYDVDKLYKMLDTKMININK
ncbi:DUF1887 family protein [bacterium]|nr:DUF1887 family protein [bacterium]